MTADIKVKAMQLGIHNLTENLAEVTGKSIGSISHKMSGKTPWSADEIKAVARAWDLTPIEVFQLFIN